MKRLAFWLLVGWLVGVPSVVGQPTLRESTEPMYGDAVVRSATVPALLPTVPATASTGPTGADVAPTGTDPTGGLGQNIEVVVPCVEPTLQHCDPGATP